MLLWIMVILIGALVTAGDVLLLSDKRKPIDYVKAFVRQTLVVNLSSFAIMKYVFGVENVFFAHSHHRAYPFKYLGLAACVGLVVLIITAFLRRIFILEKAEPKNKKGAMAAKIIAIILFALGIAAFTGTEWGKEAFGELTPDQILINLNSPTEGTDVGVYIGVLEGPVLKTLLFTTLFAVILFAPYKLNFDAKIKNKVVTILPLVAIRIIALVASVAIFISGFVFLFDRFQLLQLFSSYATATTYIEDRYVNPETTKLIFPEEKRNLIFIYLESMENTYFSKDLGGYMDENLMPDLAELSKEGISFSHKADKFGGPIMSTGSNWSVASMVNVGTGLPMKVPVDGNSYGSPGNFLPGATAIGDILAEQGYEQTLMFGADASFGGLDYYYQSHGDFNILDYDAVREKGMLPKDYYVWWGYEDDKLYEYAKTELIRLANTGKPFNFVMETADTHAPNGYLSPNAPTPFDSQYANAIHYSQAEATKFVRWIQEQDFYENTTIIILGDHLSMASAFFEGMDSSYQRTCYNLILNPHPSVANVGNAITYNRTWALFDMFPTMLASIGVQIEGNKLALGTNLFSGEKTLFEREGVATVNSELVNRSDFYNNNILVDPDKYKK